MRISKNTETRKNADLLLAYMGDYDGNTPRPDIRGRKLQNAIAYLESFGRITSEIRPEGITKTRLDTPITTIIEDTRESKTIRISPHGREYLEQRRKRIFGWLNLNRRLLFNFLLACAALTTILIAIREVFK